MTVHPSALSAEMVAQFPEDNQLAGVIHVIQQPTCPAAPDAIWHHFFNLSLQSAYPVFTSSPYYEEYQPGSMAGRKLPPDRPAWVTSIDRVPTGRCSAITGGNTTNPRRNGGCVKLLGSARDWDDRADGAPLSYRCSDTTWPRLMTSSLRFLRTFIAQIPRRVS